MQIRKKEMQIKSYMVELFITSDCLLCETITAVLKKKEMKVAVNLGEV